MRRLPVYILIQTSGAMKGEPIESIKVGLESMIASLRQDPFALESVQISIITFDKTPNEIVPMTELENLQIPVINQPVSAGVHFGEALQMLCNKVDKDVKLSTPDRKGDWMPLLFIMADGRASDIQLFKEMVPKLKRRNFSSIVACCVGTKRDISNLELLATTVVSLDTTDSSTFKQFFKWVSDSVGVGNRSIGASEGILLPPPPAEVHTVI
jgi:uncharacterized protein YegL